MIYMLTLGLIALLTIGILPASGFGAAALYSSIFRIVVANFRDHSVSEDAFRPAEFSSGGNTLVHPRSKTDEYGRNHQETFRFCQYAGRLHAGWTGTHEHHREPHLRRHVGCGRRGRRRSRPDRTQSNEGSRLRRRILGCGNRRVVHDRTDISAEYSDGRLRLRLGCLSWPPLFSVASFRPSSCAQR